MSKDSLIKYYQNNKEKACERYQSLSKEEKKCNNMVANDIKISQKMKTKAYWVNYYNYKKLLFKN